MKNVEELLRDHVMVVPGVSGLVSSPSLILSGTTVPPGYYRPITHGICFVFSQQTNTPFRVDLTYPLSVSVQVRAYGPTSSQAVQAAATFCELLENSSSQFVPFWETTTTPVVITSPEGWPVALCFCRASVLCS